MSEVLLRVRVLVAKGEVEVTQHGFRELSADDDAVVVEDYPQANRGPSVLVLQRDGDDNPVHIVWDIPRGRAVAGRPHHRISARPASMVVRFHQAQIVMKRQSVEFVPAGNYAAEVPIVLIEDEGAWSPRMSLDDARKLETVRLALKRNDLATASKHGRIFALMDAPA